MHAARHDAGCVLHTHSLNGVAVSAQKGGVLPLSQQSIFVLSSLGYHDYEGVALRDDEKPRLVHDLGDRTYLMLRNHGLLTVGATVADAFLAMYFFETVCTIQVRAHGRRRRTDATSTPAIIATAQAAGGAGHARAGRPAHLARAAAPARPPAAGLRRLSAHGRSSAHAGARAG